METPKITAPIASPSGVNPDGSVNKITNNRIVVQFFSALAIGFFLMYAYKTYLDVKVAKQQLKINEQEAILNKALLDEQVAP